MSNLYLVDGVLWKLGSTAGLQRKSITGKFYYVNMTHESRSRILRKIDRVLRRKKNIQNQKNNKKMNFTSNIRYSDESDDKSDNTELNDSESDDIEQNEIESLRTIKTKIKKGLKNADLTHYIKKSNKKLLNFDDQFEDFFAIHMLPFLKHVEQKELLFNTDLQGNYLVLFSVKYNKIVSKFKQICKTCKYNKTFTKRTKFYIDNQLQSLNYQSMTEGMYDSSDAAIVRKFIQRIQNRDMPSVRQVTVRLSEYEAQTYKMHLEQLQNNPDPIYNSINYTYTDRGMNSNTVNYIVQTVSLLASGDVDVMRNMLKRKKEI
jgi:hypothetical protein